MFTDQSTSGENFKKRKRKQILPQKKGKPHNTGDG